MLEALNENDLDDLKNEIRKVIEYSQNEYKETDFPITADFSSLLTIICC